MDSMSSFRNMSFRLPLPFPSFSPSMCFAALSTFNQAPSSARFRHGCQIYHLSGKAGSGEIRCWDGSRILVDNSNMTLWQKWQGLSV